MKKIAELSQVIMLIVVTLMLSIHLVAQQTYQPREEKKYIEVTGSAEMSVQPNSVELEIVLTERFNNGKSRSMDKIEKDFFEILEKNQISQDEVRADDYTNGWYWWYWWNNRHRSYTEKTYHLKLNNETDFLSFLKDLDEPFTRSVRISKTSHDELQRFRKEVKMEAVKAAKKKAGYLLESVGEEVGSILFVEEMQERSSPQNRYWWHQNNQQNLLSNSVVNYTPGSGNSEVDNVTQIKLRYEIKARFEIK